MNYTSQPDSKDVDDDEGKETLYHEIFAECNQDTYSTEGKTRTKGHLLQSPLAVHAKARAADRRREWRESK